ncbi:beta propeller repeat protein [Spirosoma aerophilum]
MKTVICFLILVGIFSCKKTALDTIAPEYLDWYTLKAPIDEEIQAVWGDWDKTLLIATTFNVFRSTDQGKNWQQVDQHHQGLSGIVDHQDTLFVMTGVLNGSTTQIMANVSKYSVDEGKTWQAYRKYNPFFDRPATSTVDPKLYINPVTASTGTVYKINQVFLDGPTATSGRFETPGIITSDGRRIDLPQLHQLHSLYLDAQQRLYISGTDAVCGRGHSGEAFSFCNSKNGRGVVYVSRQPLP